MNKTWNSSPHPISDIRDWQLVGRLEIRPDFQRHEVWSGAAKIMLMDTILRKIPMPKIFVASTIKDQFVHRTVIDGQQRISGILSFLRDEFALTEPYPGEHAGLRFRDLPEIVKNDFLQYRIDFNEAIGFTDEELRETYSRLNKYSIALTKQELRRADFPGDFLALSEKIASNEYLEQSKIFTVANRRRLADVEFVSELLAGLIAGPQDKKDQLDWFYLTYSKWKEQEKANVNQRFASALTDLQIIFSECLLLETTRFRQKADFYSLLLAIDSIRTAGGHLNNVDVTLLRKDLQMLNFAIAPESANEDCRSYALKCVSQGNSSSSRRYRQAFLSCFLAGTYLRTPPQGDAAILFYRMLEGWHQSPLHGPMPHSCGKCKQEIPLSDEAIIGWPVDAPVFQMSNASWLHKECANSNRWVYITSEGADNSPSFHGDHIQQKLI